MKKVFVMVCQFATLSLFAQTNSTKIEQYCQVTATPRLLSNKVTIDIDYGEEKSFWIDMRLREVDGKLKKFNTVIDALNFMGRQGWIFINAYPVTNGSTTVYHYGFRKQFSKAAL
ncbi:hypothetical protein [Flavisolibacter tropicus]|uniref:Uncharacterized protein n=1 Tax=Flavisolibacter tropicus TaxID=1492898 RepID=A0A172U1S4_9BACT|nr:hypothetical protein [Flavisolibacter tropicus]ANE53074.1 hypothetical protein SY85_23965 [Flavisolibacter tropicus]